MKKKKKKTGEAWRLTIIDWIEWRGIVEMCAYYALYNGSPYQWTIDAWANSSPSHSTHIRAYSTFWTFNRFSYFFFILLFYSLSLSLNQSVVLYIADSIKKWLIHASTLANRTNPEYECERVMLHSDKREKCVSDTHSRCFTTTTTIITIYECVCASLTSRHRVIISFLPINILGHWI